MLADYVALICFIAGTIGQLFLLTFLAVSFMKVKDYDVKRPDDGLRNRVKEFTTR